MNIFNVETKNYIQYALSLYVLYLYYFKYTYYVIFRAAEKQPAVIKSKELSSLYQQAITNITTVWTRWPTDNN